MIFSKPLILKGIAGVGVITAGGVGITYRKEISSYFNQSQSSNPLSIPDGCKFKTVTKKNTSVNCEISEDDLKKIKFKDIGENPTVEGFPAASGKITLKIEYASGSDYPNNRKYTISKLTNQITIKNSSDTSKTITLEAGAGTVNNFKESDNGLEKVVAVPGQVPQVSEENEVQKANKKLADLVLPAGCNFTGTSISSPKTCAISKEQLSKIKFSNKTNDETLTVEVAGNSWSDLTLEIRKLERNRKADYGFTAADEFLFTFRGGANKITIKNSQNKNNVILEKGTNPEFKINNSNKLEKLWSAVALSKKVGLVCKAKNDDAGSYQCTISEDSGLKMKVDGNKLIGLKPDDDSKDKELILSMHESINQGFQINVDDISAGGASVIIKLKKDNDESITHTIGGDKGGNNPNYEIKYFDDGWYLVEKALA